MLAPVLAAKEGVAGQPPPSKEVVGEAVEEEAAAVIVPSFLMPILTSIEVALVGPDARNTSSRLITIIATLS